MKSLWIGFAVLLSAASAQACPPPRYAICDLPTDDPAVRSTAGIYFYGSGTRCSATLMAQSPMDTRPLLLTAAHCVDASSAGAWDGQVTVAWRATGDCAAQSDDMYVAASPRQDTRASLIGVWGDIAMIELQAAVPAGVRYSGWDARPLVVSDVVGANVSIHHHSAGRAQQISRGTIIEAGRMSDGYASGVRSQLDSELMGGASGSGWRTSNGDVFAVTSRGGCVAGTQTAQAQLLSRMSASMMATLSVDGAATAIGYDAVIRAPEPEPEPPTTPPNTPTEQNDSSGSGGGSVSLSQLLLLLFLAALRSKRRIT
ncbi:hypothetical protein [Hydrocarboniphaga effusa]|jgi:hypothetical protein|uniref:trypsin-like serine peptidase n=1 Tax=Hydrocarboniphaga effusa TaxID=243629 RepID=UPI0031379F83